MKNQTIFISLASVAVFGLLAVGVVGASAQNKALFGNTDVQAALKAGDLGALKTALLANADTDHKSRLDKINGLTDADLAKLKTQSDSFAVVQAKQTEYETRLTDILKKDINNKDEFKKVAKEGYDAIKALREANRPVDTTKPARVQPEITDAQLEEAYTKAADQVKAGNPVTLIGGRGFGRGHGDRGGKGGQEGTNLKGLSTELNELNPNTIIN
jgi:hypothetical protein